MAEYVSFIHIKDYNSFITDSIQTKHDVQHLVMVYFKFHEILLNNYLFVMAQDRWKDGQACLPLAEDNEYNGNLILSLIRKGSGDINLTQKRDLGPSGILVGML